MDDKLSDERSATDSGRIQGFSDGCFAIIITLLVIDIRRPHAAEGELGHALLEAWPTYAAYALAFTYVGVIWLNHHGLFRHIQRVDTRLNWINLGIIGTSALIPFPTAVLAEAFQAANLADQRAAVALYGIVAAFMSLAWAPIFPHLERHRQQLASSVSPGYFAAQKSRPWIGVFAYGIAIATGWWLSPWLAIFIFCLMVIYHARTSEGISNRSGSQSA